MHLSLLGPLELTLDGRRIPLGAPKQRAVLAILGLEVGRTVSVQRLVEGLWGEEPPGSAAKLVQLHVSHLRKLLAEDGTRIVTHGRGYELQLAREAVDTERLADLVAAAAQGTPGAARAALGLWRGDALADLAAEPFAAAAIRRLEDLRLRAAELAVDADLAAGRHAEVVGELERLVAANPLRERLHAGRMLALYRSGRQAEALDAYREAREVLVEEIGVEPGKELQDLQAAVLRHDPALELPAKGRAEAAPRPPPPSAGPPPLPPPPAPGAGRARPRRRPRRQLVVAGALACLAALAALALTWDTGPELLDGIDEDAVGMIDPEAGGVVEEYGLGAHPGALAAGGGSMWVLNTQASTVSRIERGRAVTTIPVDRGPVGLAFGAGSLWVTSPSEGTLSQIVPASNRVVQTFDVGNAPTAVAVGFGAVWVASEVDRTVTRIDLARPGTRTRIPVGAGPTVLAAGAGAVWAASEEGGAVFRIEPRTREVVRSIGVGEGPGAIAVDDAGVWIAHRQAGSVWRIDPATDAVSDTMDVGGEPVGVAAGAGGIWVADAANGTVSALDPSSHRKRVTVRVGSSPAAIAVTGGKVWISALAPRSSHRGGTLRVQDQPPCDGCFEPGSYEWEALGRLSLAYDGLLSYQRAGGATYGPLVANLAEDVPEPSADGRTYVFRLRRGIRYSDGRLVRPDDVRASLEAHMRRFDWGPSYRSIVGASACRIRPPRCDLARGIRTDAVARTVTFRLRRPDPEFLYALAYPFAYVVPQDRPFGPTVQPPGTGPYRFLQFDGRGAHLVRNPHFREWSRVARPDGFPDEIVVRHNADVEPQIRAVQEGRADVLTVGKPFGTRVRPDRMLALRTGQPGRLHTNPEATLDYLWLNSRVPPFDDVRVRQALNYAIDRRRVVELAGTEEQVQLACQFVPPGFPGYAPECRYTADPGPAGAWKAPDLARALRLVARSRTAGTAVVVWGYPEKRALFEYVVDLLDRLGYRASLRMSADYFAAGRRVTDPANQAQTSIQGFGADGPIPSSFVGGFRCRSPYPPLARRYNPEAFCDQELERRVRAALGARGTDAERRWRAAYRRLADVAPAVPLVHRRTVTLVSERVRNHQHHPLWGTLYDQLWVR